MHKRMNHAVRGLVLALVYKYMVYFSLFNKFHLNYHFMCEVLWTRCAPNEAQLKPKKPNKITV